MAEINTRRAYRNALLIPLSLALAILMLTILVLAYQYNQRDHAETRAHALQAVDQALRLAVDRDSDKLGALITVLLDNQTLQTHFRQRDRSALLASTQGLFQRLREEHGITHLYFMTPVREMFLRVHQPFHFGDTITRKTALEAERTQSLVSGLELGVHGVFSLRVVAPWWDQAHNFLGFVEFGMEIDKTLAQLHELSGVELLMLVEKKYLDRQKWEEGARLIGLASDWDQYPAHVLVGRTRGADPNLLRYHRFSGTIVSATAGRPYEVVVADRVIEFGEVPLRDFAGNAVGVTVILSDLSEKRAMEHQFIGRLLGAMLLVWVLLMLVAKSVVDHVYDRLRHTVTERDSYQQQSQHDSLTELLNQTAFYHALDRDLEGCRKHGRELTVLLLDIDHFKQVNDTYGHLAGDAVLRDISSLLRDSARPRDSVARYGGEEFTIILPQTNIEDALRVAERIRESVEKREIVTAGHSLRVTLSIGLASFPHNGETSNQLVGAADHAMYAAKVAGRNRVAVSSAVAGATGEAGTGKVA